MGEYKDYRVVVNGTVTDQAANALPAAVGQCDAVTPQNPGAGSGLVNVVTMEGDSDGPANNIVCEPVELRRLNIEKRIDGRENPSWNKQTVEDRSNCISVENRRQPFVPQSNKKFVTRNRICIAFSLRVTQMRYSSVHDRT